MRRIVIWLASTVTVVVLLFGYHTSTDSAATAASPSSAGAPTTPTTTTTPKASDPPTPSSSSSTASSSPSSSASSSSSSTGTKSWTGDVAPTRWGPVEVKITVSDGTITKVTVLQSPSGNGRDVEINDRALPVLTQETLDAQSAEIDMVSGATVTSGGYLTSLQSALDQAGIWTVTTAGAVGDVPVRRYVEHVMGLPISLALRGRHAGTTEGRAAWAEVMDELTEVDHVFSTYRSDSAVSRLDRGEIGLDACPAEVAEVVALGHRAAEESGHAFSIHLPGGPAGRRRLDPSGVVKGWAAERAARHLARLDGTDYCLSAGGDITCRASARSAPWRIGVEDPRDPGRVLAVVPVRTGAVATSGTAHRGAHLVDARTGRPPTGVTSVTVVGPSLTWADIDATAAFAQGKHAAAWLETRPIDSALVVTPDGRITTVVPPR